MEETEANDKSIKSKSFYLHIIIEITLQLTLTSDVLYITELDIHLEEFYLTMRSNHILNIFNGALLLLGWADAN